MENQVVRCQRCNEKLNPKKIVWLELSMTDGNYYECEKFPSNHESQGGFSFGSACAKTQVKETEKNISKKNLTFKYSFIIL